MKKLIISAIAVLTITGSYAITQTEAIASKDYSTIKTYCLENKIKSWDFLFKSNNVSKADIVTIYKSLLTIDDKTNKTLRVGYDKFWILTEFISANKTEESYQFMIDNMYDFGKLKYEDVITFLCKFNSKKGFEDELNCHSIYVRQILPDFLKVCTNELDKTMVCIQCYNLSKDMKYANMVNYQYLLDNKKYSIALNYALAINDIDKIIDVLLVMPEIDDKQATAIIAPINSVDSEFRKADIVKALNNINSRCTIKLYDDQKTWEPILAKIRAMINIRK